MDATIEIPGRAPVHTTIERIGELARSIRREQLTFDVGGDDGHPAHSTFKISGELTSRRDELEKGQTVTVTLADMQGNVIARSYAWVNMVAFKEHRPEDADPWTERVHSVKLMDPIPSDADEEPGDS